MKNIGFAFLLTAILGFGNTLFAQEETQFTRNKIESIIEHLSSDEMEGRETGTPGAQRAGDYIETMFQYLGLEAGGENGTYFQKFSVTRGPNPHTNPPRKVADTIVGRNVLAYINNNADKTIVIGGHYDHLGYGGEGSLYDGGRAIHNGADDNASGVGGVLELARVLSMEKLNHNILFMAFSGEEKGLLGSNFFTKHALLPLSDISFMVNMDMIGRLNEENTLAVSGLGTTGIFEKVIASVENDFQLKLDKSGSGPSDHASFYYAEVPILAFFTGQHSDYHKPSDDEELINYDGLLKILDYIHEIVVKLDKEVDFTYQKTEDANKSKRHSYKVTLGVMPDYMYSGNGMRLDGVSDGKTADVAGLLRGDIVTKMGEVEVTDMMSYMKALGAFDNGQETMVTIIRDEKEMKVKVKFQ